MNPPSKTLIRLSRLSSAEYSSRPRTSTSQRKIRPDAGSSALLPETRAATASSYRPVTAHKISSMDNTDGKGWTTDRSILSNAPASTTLGLTIQTGKRSDTRRRIGISSASSMHVNTLMSSNLVSYKQIFTDRAQNYDENGNFRSENSPRNVAEIRESIMRDIPRMRDISPLVSSLIQGTKEKLRKIDKIYTMDLSRTFRSKFEEQLITEIEEKANSIRKLVKIRSKNSLYCGLSKHIYCRY